MDLGATQAPSPCVGGADQSGTSGSSRWITNDPPAPGISTPFGTDGSFEVTLDLVADDGTVDCFDAATSCKVVTRADHTDASNRSADVKVPVYFVGQTPPTDPDPDPEPTPVTLSAISVRAGGQITVSGSGFIPGEQVQVILHSDPIVLGVVVADDQGAVSTTQLIPSNAPVGSHQIELRGVTSGVSVLSADFQVTAAAAGPSTRTSATGTTASGALPRTGSSTGAQVALGLALLGGGFVLVTTSERTRRTAADRA
ncbi:MAG: LPXTG cell wall anchor domain-containing protein [Acidimicrobiia bacterium]